MAHDIAIEREHKRKSAFNSLVFHLVIILLAFLTKCSYDKAVENQYAVAINFEEIEFKPSANSNKSSSTSGEPRKTADPMAELDEEKVEPVQENQPEVKKPNPTPTPPTPTDPVITETTMEDSEIEAAKDDIEYEEPETEPVPDPEPDPVPEKDPEPAPREQKKESTTDRIKSKILDVFKSGGGKKTDNPDGPPSRSDGSESGTGEGGKGTGQGKDDTGDDGDSGRGTGGAGVGEYDDSGDGVFGRRVIHRNINEIMRVGFENQEGKKIVAKFCVNRAGYVTYAELIENETNATIPNGRQGRKDVLEGIYGYRVEPDPTAPREQCGKLTVTLSKIDAFAPGK